MRKLAATTSWGLALSGVLVLPFGSAAGPRDGQSVPVAPAYTTAWTTDFAAEAPVFVAASPTVVVTAGPAIDVVARRPTDGSPLWAVPGGRASVAPVMGDGLVFIASDSTLAARVDDSGAPAWSATLAAPVTQAPAWVAGAVVVATEAGIEAFRSNGTRVWGVALPGIVTRPVLGGGVIYAGVASPAIVALTLADGTERWRRALPGVPGPILALSEVIAFSTSDGGWTAYRPDGERRWAYPPRSGGVGVPAADDRHIYLAMLDNTVQAFDRKSGNRRWVTGLDQRPALGPTLLSGELILPGGGGDVLAVPTADGARRARRVFDVGTGLSGAALEAFAVDAAGGWYLIVSAREEPGYRLHAVRPGSAGH